MSEAVDRVLEALTRHGSEPRETPSGWTARCPAHEDRRPSLSISEGDDGRALLKCHAGCSAADVASAIGLKTSDLFAADTTKPRETRAAVSFVGGRPRRSFETAAAAVASLEQRLGPRSCSWTYHDAGGNPVGLVCRWDGDSGKTLRPISLIDGKWECKAMPEPRPLYCLPEAASADRVFVCEGEKAADAIASLGLTATTAAGGSSAATKTDWSPLARKEAVILPDNDAPGEKYAADVVRMLSAISPRPSVKIVRLPGVPDKGDAADYLEGRDVSTARQEIETLAADAEVVTLRGAESNILPYRRFPVDTLPPSARRLVISAAKSLGCDKAFITLPMLPVLSSAIGCTRCLELKPGWRVLPILWSAVIGESGTAKSPAFRLVKRPLNILQRDRLDEHAAAMKRYDQDMTCYEKSMAAWRKDKSDTLPPDKPREPVAVRYVIADATVEATLTILRSNPRGVLLARDEIAGWIGSFDRYASGSGDEAHWLSMHSGEDVVVDRKTGRPQDRTITVPRAAASICGGIQPSRLPHVIDQKHRDSGLLARFLLAQPPRHRKRWSTEGIDPQIETAYGRLLKRLHSLTFDEATERPEPVVVDLSPAAAEAWKKFFEEHAALTEEATGALASAFSKLEEAAARLAIVLEFATWADGDELEPPTSISGEAMRAAIEIIAWFTHETRRVYGTFGESDKAREERLILEWVQRRGGRATAREAGQNLQAIENSDVADLAMGRLVAAGLGRWEDKPHGPRGGRPSRVFVLTDAPPLTKPHETAETASFVGEEAEELVI